MKLELMKLDLFDGESGDPAPEIETDNGNNATEGREAPIDDNSAFDRPSPLLFAGSRDGEEEKEGAGDNDDTDGASEKKESAPAIPGSTQEPQAPFKVLRYRGQDVPVQTEQDLIELASQGIDYTRKTQQLAPYRKLIESLEGDRLLMSKVVDMINGVAPREQQARPQPQQQTQTPAQRGPQPVWDAGETYEEFSARKAAWESEGTNGQPQNAQPQRDEQPESFQQQFDRAVSVRQMQATAQALAQRTMQDERNADVLEVVAGLPNAIREAMNSDPVSYQMIYDQIRSNITGQTYFARPSSAPTQAAAPAQQQVQPTQAQKPTPYTEGARGQKGPASGKQQASGLPDFWKMTDKEFEGYSERQRFK